MTISSTSVEARPEGLKVHSLRDFWASPGSGSHGKAKWQQTMGSMVLRVLLGGMSWHETSAEEFQVRLCERGLRVTNKSRPDASAAFLSDSLNGDFLHEVLVKASWWTLEADNADGHILTVHLVKAHDRSWPQPFHDGRPKPAADVSADWLLLKEGRPADPAAACELTIKAEELLQELVVMQTPELLTVRLLLNEAKLEEATSFLPMSRLWALDLTEDGMEVSLRCAGSPSVFSARLGGRVVPSQTDWNMTKVTRSKAASGDGVSQRQTQPALSVQLRKAPDSRCEWEPAIIRETADPVDDGSQSLGALDTGASSLLELDSEAHGDGTGAHDRAMALKASADSAFRKQSWEEAVGLYTRALELTPNNEKLLSNRSAAFMELKQYQASLDDANRAEEIAPNWPKSFFRQGLALRALKRYDMAISVFSEGKARDPSNASWQKEIEETEAKKAARQAARRSR